MAADDVSCDVYTANVTSLVRQVELALLAKARDGNTSLSSSSSSPHGVSRLVTEVLSPAVCLFGVIGNALNLVVLTRRRLQHSMDGLERSVKPWNAPSGSDWSPWPCPMPSSASSTCWPRFCCRPEPSTSRTRTAQPSTLASTTR